MMGRSKNKNITLWGQGGVALADILANSVAVILILIVVTLSVQQEKADLELEKNADITTLLARQIATTVVYNDLPSSPPAVLHDYKSCRIPHDCNPALYPIIELRQSYIREYNSDLRFYRKELLKPNNPFDQLIQTFNAQEKLNIRIDVYDVNLYYLAIGILKEHNILPRHWHYLGENVKPLISPAQALADGKHGAADELQEKLGDGDHIHETGKDGNAKEGQAGKEGKSDSQSLDNTHLADLETLQEIQHDSLLPPSDEYNNEHGNPDGSDGSNSPQNADGSSDQQGQQGKGDTKVKPETMFESLIDLLEGEGMLSQGQGKGQGQSQQGQQGRRSLQMHVPNAKSLGQQQGQKKPETISLDPDDYNRVLLAFFLDQLQLARTQKTSFIQGLDKILQRYAQDPSILANHPNITLIEQFDTQLKRYFVTKPSHDAPLDKIIGNTPNQLQLTANQVNTTSTLLINQQDALWSNNITTQNTAISLILRAFPGLYKGQRLDFPKGHLLIVHPNETQHPEMQWRPILIVDPWLEDASIGFVKAAYTDNILTLDAQTLGTQINKTLIPEPKLQANPQSKNIATTLYIGIGLLLFLLLITGITITLTLRKKNLTTVGT